MIDVFFHKLIGLKPNFDLMKQFLRNHDTDKAHKKKPRFVIQDNNPLWKLQFSRKNLFVSCVNTND